MGLTVQFKCISETMCSWTFYNRMNDRILHSNVEITGKNHEILTIFNAKLKNMGIYKCITKDTGGKLYILKGALAVRG